MTPGVAHEAQRQAALLAAIDGRDATPAALPLTEQGERRDRGLDAYRANARATAVKALGQTAPTVRRMLGDADFARLAQEFRAAHPPVRGDLGEWHDALPAFIEAHPALLAWPWLADGARLDLAIHHNERAADAVVDQASLRLLGEVDPAGLRLVLVPGTSVLRSRWPIVAIHRAHAAREGAPADAAFAAVRRALAAHEAESAMVVRCGWRGVLHLLDAPGEVWLRSVLAGQTLATALENAGERFDFSAWLARAVREAWIAGIVQTSNMQAADSRERDE